MVDVSAADIVSAGSAREETPVVGNSIVAKDSVLVASAAGELATGTESVLEGDGS